MSPLRLLDCKVLKMPQPGTWMNRTGRAKCLFCGAVFPITIESEIEENPNGW